MYYLQRHQSSSSQEKLKQEQADFTWRLWARRRAGNIGILARSCSAELRPRKASNRNSNLGTVLASISGLPLTNLKQKTTFFGDNWYIPVQGFTDHTDYLKINDYDSITNMYRTWQNKNLLVNGLFLHSLIVEDPGGLGGGFPEVQLELRVGNKNQVEIW